MPARVWQAAASLGATRWQVFFRVVLPLLLPTLLTGFGLAVEIGDWDRLTGASIGAYLGLVPTTRQSGRSCSHGRITKAGSAQARGLLTQAAQHVARHPGPLGAFFRRLVKRKRRQVAITAVAR